MHENFNKAVNLYITIALMKEKQTECIMFANYVISHVSDVCQPAAYRLVAAMRRHSSSSFLACTTRV